MMRHVRLSVVLLSALSLSACLGGGKKVPPTLLTLTSSAPAPADLNRSAAPGQTITIDVPVIPKELSTTRVPAQIGPTAIAYVENLQWVESPDRLFQDLVQETVMRTTNRVVLDPRQSGFDPGTKLTGTLSRFGYDAQEGAVIVRYDAALNVPGASQVQTRRFEARESANGTASTVGPALNSAANRVAAEVAQWVGNN